MLDKYKKILVTGGAGFIGSHLVDALLDLGKEVVIFDATISGSPKNFSSKAKLIKGDIRKPEQIKEAVKGIDLVFHAAANANGTFSVNNPQLDFDINATGTLNILEAASQAKVKKFVYLSSAAVYGRPLYSPIDEKHSAEPYIPYGGAKYAGEVYCHVYLRAYHLPMIIGRSFCVYGSRENHKTALVEVSRYLRWHLNQKPIQIIGDIDKKIRDFVHVDDVVQGLLLIADCGGSGEVFNIGSGEATSMRKLVDIIGSVTGKEPITKVISEIQDDTYSLVADISKIKSIGYTPKIPLIDGIKQLAKKLGEFPEMPEGATIFQKGQKSEK
ncbi:MAG: NAD-dependent epimerase/dehydratase family protein [Candidatus Nealsonbacteria bacterium]